MTHTHTHKITFNEFIGKENMNKEFKAFTFNGSGLFDDTDKKYAEAEYYCQTYSFDFNSNVLKIIKRYIRLYLPKYTCAFLNSNVPGKLYIGVNDYGFVKGIPFQGDLPIKLFKKKIFNIIKDTVKNNINREFDFEKLISVDIVKINHPDKPTKPLESLVNFMSQKQAFIKAYNEFVENIKNWKIRHNFFTQKLIDLVNNIESRMMLIEYIRRINPESIVIGILESDYVLEYRVHDDVNILKEDQDNPYYWVCKWKDEMSYIIKKNKPVFNQPEFNSGTPYNIIISANDMIPYWIHNNPSMNLYLITVRFNTLMSTYSLSTSSKLYFSYLPHNNKKWTSCYRNVLSNGEAVCTPY